MGRRRVGGYGSRSVTATAASGAGAALCCWRYGRAVSLGPGEHVSPHGVEAILEEHFQCLLEHKVIERNRANRFPAAMAAQMLRDLETKLEQCRGSWAVALRIER